MDEDHQRISSTLECIQLSECTPTLGLTPTLLHQHHTRLPGFANDETITTIHACQLRAVGAVRCLHPLKASSPFFQATSHHTTRTTPHLLITLHTGCHMALCPDLSCLAASWLSCLSCLFPQALILSFLVTLPCLPSPLCTPCFSGMYLLINALFACPSCICSRFLACLAGCPGCAAAGQGQQQIQA